MFCTRQSLSRFRLGLKDISHLPFPSPYLLLFSLLLKDFGITKDIGAGAYDSKGTFLLSVCLTILQLADGKEEEFQAACRFGVYLGHIFLLSTAEETT